jgi:DNA-directed RNA polymerase II subunit RPB2
MAEAAALESLSSMGLQILEKYFSQNEFPLTRHHIDSYEKCVFEDIPSIIHSNNPITFLKEPLDADKTVFGSRVEIFIGGEVERPEQLALQISPPVVTVDSGNTVRRMFPNEARLRNLTYSAEISADIQIKATFTRVREGAAPGTYDTEVKQAPLIKNFPLFRLPILLRSRLCPTGVSDPARLMEMGECRNDYGGYFIVGGAEKILITREEQAFNTLYVEKQATNEKDPVQAYASVVSLNPETKQTRRVAMYLGRHGEIRVAIPMVRGAFPLFILFRAMGIESDEEIVQMIFPDVADNTLAEALIPSIEDAYPIYNKYTATKYIMTLTKGFTEAHVLDILQNLMLPHVPDEPFARAQYLAEMARECIRADKGLRPKADRDDMRAHRFLTTGTLLRELFNGCYKEWRKLVELTVDTAYRKNSDLYQGDAVFNLFDEGNAHAIFEPAALDKAILRGFRGRWGTDATNEKSGVLQPLARISYLDATSHQRRVVSDFDSAMKTTGPRKMHTSQVGYFCTSETPTGAHIGLTKNMSITTQFSFSAPTKPLYDWMKIKGGLIPVANTTASLRASAAVVQLNGGTVGFTLDPVGLVQTLRYLKWNACLSPTASISFNTTEKTVRILVDEGRPVRPLWHLNGAGAAFLQRLPEFAGMNWRSLVFGTYPPTASTGLSSTTFLDPLAENPEATFADYAELLAPTAGFIEYCDPVEMNEAYVSWWGTAEELTPQHTHAEIHPSTLTGLMASMIPFSNHNQAPRNQLSNSQSKQGIGYMATNIHSRFDTYAHQLCYGEAPLCRTFYYENIANGEMPYGFNCVVAATSDTGYNQDDGLIVNRSSVERGMFRSLSFRSYDCEEEVDPMTKVHSHVANPLNVPSWTNLRPGLDYSQLDERGIIREGTIVTDKTVLVGRYMVIPATNEVKDASVTPGLYTQGRVDSVVVLTQGDGKLLVKVRIIEMRLPVLGDKFSTRHGQKGTIGMLVSAADLPRTADGVVPDIMVNPGGLISRMTVAQLVEMVAGRVGAEVAAKINATTFCNDGTIVTRLGDVLQSLGASRAGDAIMYCGVSGKQLATEIFVCPLYFMRLKHLTDDKVNARGAGKRELRTHQPTGGRANEGGLRIGEMERDSLCAHGVAGFLQESMMKRGDGTTFWICNGCGRIPIYNEAENLFVCPTCDGPLEYSGVTAETLTLQLPTKQSRATFSRIAIPYTLKLLDQELTTFQNTGLRFVTEGSVARLRDGSWAWPEEEIEFKAGEGVAEGAEDVNPEARAEQEAAAAAAKAARKKGGRVSARTPGPEKGAEGAAEVLEAVAAQASSEEVAAVPYENPAVAGGTGMMLVGGGLGPVKFGPRIKNENVGFSNFAHAPFRMPGEQIPGPDGSLYPEFGVSKAGAPNPAKQTWPTVEHYYQAMKFPTEPDWQETIRQAVTPLRAKKMGLDPNHALRGDWDAVKERVMKSALLAKFRQNPALLARLQATGSRKLEEASPGDSYWGVGTRSKGRNRMGALLTEVRDELKGVRVDTAVLGGVQGGGAIGHVVEAAGEAEEAVYELDGVQEEARQIVAEATGGAIALPPTSMDSGVQMGGGGGGGGGGVFMIINPAIGGDLKARRARSSRGGGGGISWAGMESGGGGDGGQEGGGDEGGGGAAEITVEKLG